MKPARAGFLTADIKVFTKSKNSGSAVGGAAGTFAYFRMVFHKIGGWEVRGKRFRCGIGEFYHKRVGVDRQGEKAIMRIEHKGPAVAR